MRTERVQFQDAQGRALAFALREPTGSDELSVEGIDTRSASALLDRLMEGEDKASLHCASHRDALLAALHRLCWGDTIQSTLLCRKCNQRFDLSFSLSSMQHQFSVGRAPADPRWRVPTAEDEWMAESALSVEEGAVLLAHRCGANVNDMEEAAAALETSFPILDVDLDAQCPECGEAHQAHFDIQSFLLRRLLDERECLLDEMHLLAQEYGWPLHDILSLPRRTRKSLAQRIADGKSS